MRFGILFLAPAVAFGLTACGDGKTTAPPGGDPNTQAAGSTTMATSASVEDQANRCTEIKSSGWAANVDGMPGPNKPISKLKVSGEVALTEGGWTVTLIEKGETKDLPSTLMLELMATHSGDVSTQPIENRTVVFEREPGTVGSVSISCKRMSVAKLTVSRPQ